MPTAPARQVRGGGQHRNLQPDGSVVKLTPAWIGNADGERVDATPHPMMQYTIPCETPLMAYSLIRMQKQ